MTVIRPNSVSGITSITAQANEINVFRSNGTLAGLNLNGVNFNTTAGISTLAALKITGNLDVAGVLTYQDVTNVDSVGIITARSTIDAQGDVSIADKIIHTGDTNCAIRFPANDTISFETGGTEKFRIQPNGRVGIGTDNPPDCTLTVCEFNSGTNIYDNIALRLQGSSGQNVALQFTDTTGAAAYIAVQGDALKLGTNNTERLRITSTGDVNIGNDTAKLQLGASQDLQIFHNGSSNRIIAANADLIIQSNAYAIRSENGSSTFLNISSAGLSQFVNSTGGQIHLGGASAHTAKITITDNAGSGNGNFLFGGPSSTHLKVASGGNILVGDGSTYSPGSHVHLHGGTSGLQQLRVQNHTSIGSFDGNYGSEFRHATSATAHAMLIHCHEQNDARRTLDISDSNGIFGRFVNGKTGLGRDSGGNVSTRGVLEICAPFDDVSDNDGSADLGTNGHDAIIINIAGPGAASGKNVGSIAWGGGRRRAAIMAEYQNTDSDYIALAFFTRGTDGAGDFYKSFIINHNGSAGLHGSLSQNTSDDRLKKDKVEIENALDKVNSLSSFTHKWNEIAVRAGLEENKTEIGLSAQEVQGLYPSLVNVNNTMIDPDNPTTEYLTIHYEKVVPLLVASIKELTSEINSLKSRLSSLEGS